MNQSEANVPSINQKPIHIAPDPFLIGMFGFSIRLVSIFRELSLFAVFPHPVILRGAKGEVAESIIQQITLALRERGYRRIRWLWAEEEHFPQNS